MLTRFVRIQLAVFAIVGVLGMVAMVITYVQLPTLLGIGRITVTLQLPAAGGLYEFANVTYRGVTVGKVVAVELTEDGADAMLSLQSSPPIPADVQANVRSMSAVGEQYVDLLPRSASTGYLRDGAVIPVRDTSIPQPIGPMLDRVSALVGSLPEDRIGALLDETYRGLNGAGDDLETIVNATSTLAREFDGVATESARLIDDSVPVLEAQASSADATRTWAHSLAGITDALVANDGSVRNILQTGPGVVSDVSQLLDQVRPTLPVLLSNLASLGQVGVTYRPGLEQLLVLLPPSAAFYQAERPVNNPTGQVVGDFRVAIDDPPACTVGFLPASQWRSPADTTVIDTPDGLYCKLPQDSPIAVRGARNLPCMGHPGKRAPTVEICDSDRPFEPLAMRQHAVGPPPFDPNIVAQGVPLDDRVPGERPIFAPVEGTPPPEAANPAPPPEAANPAPLPEAANLAPPPEGANLAPLPEAANPAPPAMIPPLPGAVGTELPGGVPLNPLLPPVLAPPAGAPPVVAPSAYQGAATTRPAVAVAEYDPRTGRYLTPDGRTGTQADLVTTGAKSWRDLVLQP